MTDKPNFNIVETKFEPLDYDAFKEDFLDPFMNVEEIKEKYNIKKGDYDYYRKRVLKDTGLKRKPYFKHGGNFGDYVKTNPNQFEFIRKQNNTYLIVKTIDWKTRYYGRYADYGTAKMVRDKLIQSDWDEALAVVLKDKYGMKKRSNAIVIRAEEIYEQYKDLYMNSSLTVSEINKMYGVSSRCYDFLLKMLREDNVPQRKPRNKLFRVSV